MIFPNNARVCFIGDSITAANIALSHVVNAYKTQFSERKVKFFNCGTAGAQLFYPLKYFEEDVAFFKPTHAVISYGINDSWLWNLPYLPDKEHYDLLLEAYDTYKERLALLCKKLEGIGVKDITVCTPPPYDEYAKTDADCWHGGASLMVGYAAFVREFANEKGYKLCDYHSFLTNAKQTEEVFGTADRVHPSDHGYYLMAKCFLKTQGIEIGEYEPIPEYLNAWNERVRDLRDVHYVENNIIENKELNQEEKFNFVREFLKKEDIAEDFVVKGNKYFENRLKTEQIAKEIEEIYDRDVLGI